MTYFMLKLNDLYQII